MGDTERGRSIAGSSSRHSRQLPTPLTRANTPRGIVLTIRFPDGRSHDFNVPLSALDADRGDAHALPSRSSPGPSSADTDTRIDNTGVARDPREYPHAQPAIAAAHDRSNAQAGASARTDNNPSSTMQPSERPTRNDRNRLPSPPIDRLRQSSQTNAEASQSTTARPGPSLYHEMWRHEPTHRSANTPNSIMQRDTRTVDPRPRPDVSSADVSSAAHRRSRTSSQDEGYRSGATEAGVRSSSPEEEESRHPSRADTSHSSTSAAAHQHQQAEHQSQEATREALSSVGPSHGQEHARGRRPPPLSLFCCNSCHMNNANGHRPGCQQRMRDADAMVERVRQAEASRADSAAASGTSRPQNAQASSQRTGHAAPSSTTRPARVDRVPSQSHSWWYPPPWPQGFQGWPQHHQQAPSRPQPPPVPTRARTPPSPPDFIPPPPSPRTPVPEVVQATTGRSEHPAPTLAAYTGIYGSESDSEATMISPPPTPPPRRDRASTSYGGRSGSRASRRVQTAPSSRRAEVAQEPTTTVPHQPTAAIPQQSAAIPQQSAAVSHQTTTGVSQQLVAAPQQPEIAAQRLAAAPQQPLPWTPYSGHSHQGPPYPGVQGYRYPPYYGHSHVYSNLHTPAPPTLPQQPQGLPSQPHWPHNPNTSWMNADIPGPNRHRDWSGWERQGVYPHSLPDTFIGAVAALRMGDRMPPGSLPPVVPYRPIPPHTPEREYPLVTAMVVNAPTGAPLLSDPVAYIPEELPRGSTARPRLVPVPATALPLSRFRGPSLHPYLMPNADRPDLPSIRWDIRFPPSQAQRVTGKWNIVSLADELGVSITSPEVRSVDIAYKLRPLDLVNHFGPIRIRKDRAITIGDVLSKIYDFFQKPLREDQYAEVQRTHPDVWQSWTKAFTKRCRIYAVPDVEWSKGMKRVDCLGERILWWGSWTTHNVDGTWQITLRLASPEELAPYYRNLD